MAIKTAEDLFIHELSDIYSAEKQMAKALPRLARAATDPDLAAAFETHLEETQGQIERIDQVVELLGIRLKRIKCAAMEGLVEEGKEAIDSIDHGSVEASHSDDIAPSAAAPAGDDRAAVGHVDAVRERCVRVAQRRGRFLDRRRFAGEREPLRVWRGLALFSLVLNLVLLISLMH